MRAIEVATALGTVPEPKPAECPYDVLLLGIATDREELRARLRARAACAIERGLITETQHLLKPSYWERIFHQTKPISRTRLSEIGLEYREVLKFLDGNISKAQLIDRLEQVNWQYAKRQLTWLKRDDSIEWFDPKDISSITNRVREFLG